MLVNDDFIALRDLSIGYDGRPVLSGISVTIKRGSFTAILGANGSGKSTLLKTLLGLQPPLAGEILSPRGAETLANERLLVRGPPAARPNPAIQAHQRDLEAGQPIERIELNGLRDITENGRARQRRGNVHAARQRRVGD